MPHSLRLLPALVSILLISLLPAACSIGTGGTPADLGSRLDSLMAWRYGSDADSAPGCAVVVAAGDSIIYEHYQGLADMDTRRAIDSTTRFCIASVSKQFTVAALLQQVQRRTRIARRQRQLPPARVHPPAVGTHHPCRPGRPHLRPA